MDREDHVDHHIGRHGRLGPQQRRSAIIGCPRQSVEFEDRIDRDDIAIGIESKVERGQDIGARNDENFSVFHLIFDFQSDTYL